MFNNVDVDCAMYKDVAKHNRSCFDTMPDTSLTNVS